MGRLIDETLLQETLAKIPMEDRTFRKAVEIIEEAPTADVQPVIHGEWYKQDNWLGVGIRVTCSECNKTFILGDVRNYCPNCGAKMVGPQESEVEE